MHRLRKPIFVVLLSLLALPGCRNATGHWHSTTDLSEALLTVGDLGITWRETQRDIFDERAPENPVLDPTQFCPAGSNSASTLESLAGQAGADVEMQVKDSTRMLRLQAWDNADAEKFLDAVTSAVQACDEVEWTDESVGVTVSFTAIDGPQIGDESVHWLVVGTPPADNPDKKFGGAGRTTVARYGTVVMVLEVGDFSLDPGANMMTDDEWRSILTKASDRMSDL